ncbi:MAG: type IV toxin-antitoxin system AbiEi family antitoxin domain-containing protein [Solirubrobacterales bacterium]
MSDFRASPDALIAEIADRQYGVVSTGQLRGLGLDKDQILYRVRVGRLHRLHRGVYAVGRQGLSQRGRWTAATLACGGGAVVSHRSAAAPWGMLPDRMEACVEISVPEHGGRRKRSGIRMHRSSTLGPAQVTHRLGIPVTVPARTFSDLERVASPPELRSAARQAAMLGLGIGTDVTHDGTRSELEFRFLQLCKNSGLPPPGVNVRIGPFLADFVWPAERVIVETDGYRYHRGRAAFEADRKRDLELRALGYDVIRLSYRQVTDRPAETASAIRVAIATLRGPGAKLGHIPIKAPGSS